MSDHVRHFVSYGVRFRIRTRTSNQLHGLMSLLPHGTAPDEPGTEDVEEFTLTTEAPEGETPEQQLRTALMVHVANFAPEHVFVHAGVVSWNGKGLLLPGRSFAGKTTLVAALVRAGCLYYSDEYAVILSSGIVQPYARELQVRRSGSAAQIATPVSTLGGQSGTEPINVALVAFLQYESGAAFSPEPVTPGMAVLEVLRHSIAIQRTPQRVLSTLTTMVSTAACLRSARDEAAPAARALMSILERQ